MTPDTRFVVVSSGVVALWLGMAPSTDALVKADNIAGYRRAVHVDSVVALTFAAVMSVAMRDWRLFAYSVLLVAMLYFSAEVFMRIQTGDNKHE